MTIVDVSAKPEVDREAEAEGFLRLRPATVAAIRAGKVAKGDPIAASQVAGLLAAKRTPDLLPHCHPIPLASADVRIAVEDAGLRATAVVRARWKTGVEMEALTAVSVALLAAWDMTKSLEKDERGQYPATCIEGLRVVRKEKGPA